jgi:hypothetical protein
VTGSSSCSSFVLLVDMGRCFFLYFLRWDWFLLFISEAWFVFNWAPVIRPVIRWPFLCGKQGLSVWLAQMCTTLFEPVLSR